MCFLLSFFLHFRVSHGYGIVIHTMLDIPIYIYLYIMGTSILSCVLKTDAEVDEFLILKVVLTNRAKDIPTPNLMK